MLTYDMTVARRNYVIGFREGEEKGLKVGEERGIKQGESIGIETGGKQEQERMQKLLQVLYENGNQDDMKRVMEASREVLLGMYQQYGIS